MCGFRKATIKYEFQRNEIRRYECSTITSDLIPIRQLSTQSEGLGNGAPTVGVPRTGNSYSTGRNDSPQRSRSGSPSAEFDPAGFRHAGLPPAEYDPAWFPPSEFDFHGIHDDRFSPVKFYPVGYSSISPYPDRSPFVNPPSSTRSSPSKPTSPTRSSPLNPSSPTRSSPSKPPSPTRSSPLKTLPLARSSCTRRPPPLSRRMKSRKMERPIWFPEHEGCSIESIHMGCFLECQRFQKAKMGRPKGGLVFVKIPNSFFNIIGDEYTRIQALML
ncbi:leucine-rich repeat extensin-like protein 5 [Belonocnema kinseyi]|uniref:leucine-rich repeat extensin-like protein 5 n=1 Tax=Belonocnema kinseyi TaxID=2817044 RepID=UPI00143DF156|nr:leucine-rich repeat extensin-like protein 5 [Belonocnema kinseyi]